MTARSRALCSSCLLLALVACVEPPPPPPAQSGAAGAGAQAQGVEPRLTSFDDKYPEDPVFSGEPVSTKTLDGGIIVEDFVIGEGEAVADNWEVSVHYRGTLEDGTVFDTSRKRNRPFNFTIGQGRVIKGWDQGVPGMKVGGKRRLTVPAALAYGERKKGKIPPNSQLTFTLELADAHAPLPDAKGDEAYAGEPAQRSELDGGLIIEEFAVGEGREAKDGDSVYVHYTGKLDDGTVFDSSVPRKKPISFTLGTGKVIKGWDMGIAGMKPGGLRRLTIPAELGYGERAKGKIPANSRLTFTVELMDVRDAPPRGARPTLRSPTKPH